MGSSRSFVSRSDCDDAVWRSEATGGGPVLTRAVDPDGRGSRRRQRRASLLAVVARTGRRRGPGRRDERGEPGVRWRHRAAVADPCAPSWVTAWQSAAQPVPAPAGSALRMVVHPQVSGGAVRVRLSNAYGTAPLVIGSAVGRLGLRRWPVARVRR